MKPAITLRELQQPRILELLQITEEDLCLEHVPAKDFQNWTLENPELADNKYIRYEYNSITERLIIKCMSTATHGSLQTFFNQTLSVFLVEKLGSLKASQLFTVGSGTSFVGFKGDWSGGSEKIPDAFAKLKRSKHPAIVCEAGWTEGWEKLMEDTRLWLLYTGGETKIVIVLSFIENKPKSDPVAESESEDETTDGSSKTEEQKVIDSIDTSTCQDDLAQILQQLNGQANLHKPLIGELTATLHVYRASEDHKDIVEMFKATVLPLPPRDFTGPREFQITLHDIFGNDVPDGMNPEDPITFSLPVLEALVTGSLHHTTWYRAMKLAKKLMKEAGVWEEKETFTQSKRRSLD